MIAVGLSTPSSQLHHLMSQLLGLSFDTIAKGSNTRWFGAQLLNGQLLRQTWFGSSEVCAQRVVLGCSIVQSVATVWLTCCGYVCIGAWSLVGGSGGSEVKSCMGGSYFIVQ